MDNIGRDLERAFYLIAAGCIAFGACVVGAVWWLIG